MRWLLLQSVCRRLVRAEGLEPAGETLVMRGKRFASSDSELGGFGWILREKPRCADNCDGGRCAVGENPQKAGETLAFFFGKKTKRISGKIFG